MKPVINPTLVSKAASDVSDALEIARGMVPKSPTIKKALMLIRSRLADVLIDLHNAGVQFPDEPDH